MSGHAHTMYDQRYDSATVLPLPPEEGALYPSAVHDSPISGESISTTVKYPTSESSCVTEVNEYMSSYFHCIPTPTHEHPNQHYHADVIAPPIRPSFPPPVNSSSSPPPPPPPSSVAPIISISTVIDGNTLGCSQCGVEFTGRYRRGNLARHARHKHSKAAKVPLTCSAHGCSRTFARQDARVKHERKHHPELHCNPSGNGSCRRTASRLGKKADVFSAPLPQFTYTIDIDEVPRSTRDALCRIYTQLDNETYARLRDMFLTLLTRMVQYLSHIKSDAYHVYMRVLEEINVIVRAIESGSIDPTDQIMTDAVPHCHPSGSTGNTGRSRGEGSASNAWGIDMSKPNLHYRDKGKMAHSSQEQNTFKVAKSNRTKDPLPRKVDCPDDKHHTMYPNLGPSPCKGCGEIYMSKVRHHLNRVTHRGRPGAWQCSNCKKDFDDQHLYNAHISPKRCRFKPQCRDIVREWARLYMLRYPGVTRIPNPYCGEEDWLPQTIWEECQALLRDTSASFLDQQAHTEREADHGISPPTDPIPDESHRAASQFAIGILNLLNTLISNHPDGVLATGATLGFTNNLQPSGNPPMYHGASYPLSQIFHDTAQRFGTLAERALYGELGRIQAIANEAATVVDMANVHSSHEPPQDHSTPVPESFFATPIQPREYIFGSSNTTMPHDWSGQHQSTQHEPAKPPSINYCAPLLSRQSSRADLGTSSSHTPFPSQTNSSSVYDPIEGSLLTPLTSPHPYRRLSESTEISDLDTTQRMLPEHIALPEACPALDDPNYTDTQWPQTIDPRFLDQAEDLSEDFSEDLNRDLYEDLS
ncbi:hypothetical protein GGP41_006960 [Bipolaris sorokiniana]|uniref:C2H2-type domain-containing protein n=1 Tax=Cochliobolus sativus TaxID=45130 RepID=A0A8H6DZV3_COCSA|nr:hypothetical protein GGP41_006960 [Bipolaris sorokiniana]